MKVTVRTATGVEVRVMWIMRRFIIPDFVLRKAFENYDCEDDVISEVYK